MWPRCFLRHGWLPVLSPRTIGTPWAVSARDLALHNLEMSLGAYPSVLRPLVALNWARMIFKRWLRLSLITPLSGLTAAGRRSHTLMLKLRERGFAHPPAFFFDNHEWEHAQDLDGQFDGSPPIFFCLCARTNANMKGSILEEGREAGGVILAL